MGGPVLPMKRKHPGSGQRAKQQSNKHYKAAAASALKVISGFACLGFCLFRVLFV